MSEEQRKEGVVALEQARTSLRVTEEHFRLLVDSVRDYAIFLLTTEGDVASWNIGAQRIKGYAAGEIVGKHFSQFYPEEDVRAGKCEMELDVAGREGRFEDEGWRLRKDGTAFWANVIITALRNESGELIGFAKVTRDLTERKKAEEERIRLAAEQKAREASDAANRAKDDFLAHVSHELRTPLNAILGWSRLLTTGGGLDAERAKRANATIERNASAMAQLIDDLLDVSRIISGKMRLQVEIVDLALVIERSIESVKLAADAKGIRMQLRMDAGGSERQAADASSDPNWSSNSTTNVIGDATRLQQVVWNLLSNAVKFTPREGRIDVRLHHLDRGTLQVVVADSGQGIAMEKVNQVFEPFWQETRNVGGTRGLGLGLAICRNLVELHGGHIEARSEGEGRGATFIVNLPVAMPNITGVRAAFRPPSAAPSASASASASAAPPASVAAPSVAAPSVAAPPASTMVESQMRAVNLAAPAHLKGLRVLVVEDEADARDLVREVLQDAGCVVSAASTVGQAMAEIERAKPDVLVSDIGLPGEDGYALIQKVRALTSDQGGEMPAAALTAFARGEDRTKALNAGYTVHVAKPIDPTDLVMVVATLAKLAATAAPPDEQHAG